MAEGNTDERRPAVERALAPYLRERLDVTAEPTVRPVGDGSSNETLLVETPDRTLVLRRPPDNQPVPELLHDVTHEHDLLATLADTRVPVPTPVACSRDASVLGGPFYLMEQVEGDVLGGTEPERFATAAGRRQTGRALIDTLADLHALDPAALDASEAVESDLEAAIAGHRERIETALDRTAERRPLPRAGRIGDWLADTVPASPDRTLVHGDYKPDNVLVAPGTPPRIAAVLDWEMGGVGDPKTDLGWFLAYWTNDDDPDPIDDSFEAAFGDHELYPTVVDYLRNHSTFMEHRAYPDRRELAEWYTSRTGRTFQADRFYRALALYKLIGICERFYALWLEDQAGARDTYPMMELLVPVLTRRAEQIVEGDLPL